MGGSPASRGCDTRCVQWVCHMRPAHLSGRLLPHASSAGPGEAGIGVHPAPPAHEHVSCVGATMVSKQAGLAGIHQGFRAPPYPSSRPPSNTSWCVGDSKHARASAVPTSPPLLGGSVQSPPAPRYWGLSAAPPAALACSTSGFSRYKRSESRPTLAPGGVHCPGPHLGLSSLL